MDEDDVETVWQTVSDRPTPALVRRKVADVFPPADRAAALEVLGHYGSGPAEPERDRVRLAVVKLSGGDLDLLRQWVQTAKLDYRDALAYAEYPGQMGSGASSFQTPAADLRRVEAEDRRQYLAWLRGPRTKPAG